MVKGRLKSKNCVYGVTWQVTVCVYGVTWQVTVCLSAYFTTSFAEYTRKAVFHRKVSQIRCEKYHTRSPTKEEEAFTTRTGPSTCDFLCPLFLRDFDTLIVSITTPQSNNNNNKELTPCSKA